MLHTQIDIPKAATPNLTANTVFIADAKILQNRVSTLYFVFS